MSLDMASVITNSTAAHKPRGQVSGMGGSISVNSNDHSRLVHSSGAGQQGIGSGKTSWDSNIWGNSGFASSLRDAAIENTRVRGQMPSRVSTDGEIEGKTGSSSLLATSESEGWAGRSSLRWSLSHEKGHLPGSTRGSGFSNVSDETSVNSSPSFFSLTRGQHATLTSSSPTSRPPLQQPDAIGPSTGSANTASLGGINGYSHQQANTAAFLNNMGIPFGDRNPPTAEGGLTFQQLQQVGTNNGNFKGANNLGQTHLPRSSVSTVPDRPLHSNRPSLHSDMNDDQNHVISQADLQANFAKLHLNQDRLNVYSQTNNIQRPSFYSHPSHDGTLARFTNSVVSDDVTDFRSYTPEAPLTDSTLYAHVHGRFGARTPGSPVTTDSTRNINSPFYSAIGTPGSGNHLFRLHGQSIDPQPEYLDRKLRTLQQEQQEILRNSAHQLSFNPALNFVPYAARGINPLASLYPVTAFGGLGSIASRTPHREDSSQSLRSPLLEEFRANSKGSKRYELKDIYNHIVEFSGDQHGSRFIQQKLETANSDEKEQVFQEIKPNAIQLMMDVFGNYVIQKLFEHGNQAQKKALAQQMMGHILALSTQMYGCRVVQKALEHVLTDQQAAMVKELEHHVMRCVKDQNGNHVIQKAIERVPMEHIQFIVNDFKGQVHRLAAHPYGCRVIQRMLEHCREADRQAILAEIHACAASLIPDQFGNYVIQHVIQNGDEKDRSKILSVVISQLLVFSKHKFASNVVEKGIEYGNPSQRAEILQILLTPNERGESPLLGLMRDQYGNYVIQKVLDQTKGADRCALVAQIEPLLSQLKKLSYGKQIMAIERLIYQSQDTNTSVSTPISDGKSPTVANELEAASSGDEAAGTTSSFADTQSSRSSVPSSVPEYSVESQKSLMRNTSDAKSSVSK
ncbi:hypothetical protein VTO42DRAFT_216 [Malbranchea cinnamomea]